MTAAQGRVLDALRTLTADGWPASVREVMATAGLASSATTHVHLEALQRQGLVERHPRNRALGWFPVDGIESSPRSG